MSWSALRYQPSAVRAARSARRAARENKQEDVPGEFKLLRAEDLVKVFGLSDLGRIIQTLQRLQHMKGRAGIVTDDRPFPHKKFRGRNRHHLTPQFRKGEAYHGGGRRNLLLIHLKRHSAWHDLFGVMTLEEVIAFLVRCRRFSAGIWIATGIAVGVADALAHRKMGKAAARRSRRCRT